MEKLEKSGLQKSQDLKFDRLVGDTKKSSLRKYQEIVVGTDSLWELVKYEVLTGVFGLLPGGIGMVLRRVMYRGLFRSMSRGVVIGSNVTLRHPSKVSIGPKTVLDDLCLLSARGRDAGINIGERVLIGRAAQVKVRSGLINIGDFSHIGPFSNVGTSQAINIGKHVTTGPLCIIGIASKESNDLDSPISFHDIREKGGVIIEDDVSLGGNVTVLDGVKIGTGCVIGAGAVVTKNIPPYSIAYGVPAKVMGTRGSNTENPTFAITP